MDFSTLPLLQIILVILILIGAIVGFQLGRKKEREAQGQIIAELNQQHAVILKNIKADYEDKLKVLNKANVNEINKIQRNHELQFEQLNEQHQNALQAIENSNLKEMEQLNTKHSELVQQLTQANIQKIEELQKQHEVHISKVIAKSEEISDTLQNKFDAELSKTKQENEQLKHTVEDVQKELFNLRHKMEQDGQNNVHSLSKSGDKLIRVVRSVQELANELDETSRTVSGGEYSFFEEIQDQRDREAVLSLTQPKGDNANKQQVKDDKDESE